MSSIPELSHQELKKLISCSDKPVLVACFTQSCVPCKRMLPMLDDLHRKFSNRLTVVSVDVEKHPLAAATHDIAAVPTLLLAANGTVRERIVGVVAWKDLFSKVYQYANETAALARRSSSEGVPRHDKEL